MIPEALVDHPMFPLLADHIKIEVYDRDGGHRHPRKRLELQTSNLAFEIVRQALEAEVKCCHCGRAIHPFRARKTKADRRSPRPSRLQLPRHIYIAVACDLDTNVGCSRGAAAREAYIEIEQCVRMRRSAWAALPDCADLSVRLTDEKLVLKSPNLLPNIIELTERDVQSMLSHFQVKK